jgi:hypothetical protein
MPQRLTSRRQFLLTTAAATGSLCAPAVLRFARAQEGDIPVRLPAHELDPDHPVVQSFKAAILVMRGANGRPDYHPAHWSQLCRYHAQLCGPNGSSDPRADVHGTWWFMPWHRAYLAVVEHLMREDSGDPTFALPYWDWHRHPAIPPIFEGDPAENPLAHERRWLNGTEEAAADWQSLRDDWENTTPDQEALTVADDAFEDFAGGPILVTDEGPVFGVRPSIDPIHGRGHLYVGGYDGDMGAFPTAGFDPIFYCHHANVDRMWEVWRNSTRDGSPQRTEPSEDSDVTTWGGRPFAFQDALGGALIVRSADVLDTRNVRFTRYSVTEAPLLVHSYRYYRDRLDEALPPAVTEEPEVVALDFRGRSFLSEEPAQSRGLEPVTPEKGPPSKPPAQVLLRAKGIAVPATTTLITTALKLADGRRIEVERDPIIPFGDAGKGATFARKVVDLTEVVRRENLRPSDFTVEMTAASGQGSTQLKIEGIELEIR